MAKRFLTDLETVGRIETFVSEITQMEARLKEVPLWRPAAVLAKQASEARRLIMAMKGRMDGRLVVTLIGPSGAGKSTLFNCLSNAKAQSAN